MSCTLNTYIHTYYIFKYKNKMFSSFVFCVCTSCVFCIFLFLAMRFITPLVVVCSCCCLLFVVCCCSRGSLYLRPVVETNLSSFLLDFSLSHRNVIQILPPRRLVCNYRVILLKQTLKQ